MRLLQTYIRILIKNGIDPDDIRRDIATPVDMQIAKFDDYIRKHGLT